MSQEIEGNQPVPAPAPEMPKPKKKRHIVRWIVIAAVVIAIPVGYFVYQAVFNRPQIDFTQTVTRTATVEKQDFSETVGVDGTLAPQTKAELSFTVNGKVTSVKVAVGDKVKKGAVLATIDSTELQNQVDLAQADLESAQASYNDTSSSDSSQRKAAQAQVDAAQASLDVAKENLKAATLKSTISGTVAEVNISKGDQLGESGGSSSGGMGYSSSSTSTSSAQFLILNASKWQVEGTLSAADVGSVKAGQSATVTVGESTEALKATVKSVGIVATSTDDGQATFPVVITLDEKN
ncbi:MAG: biotin/lipoyl-binding protein, partial [Propionibacteriaceae bacterium]|nr:biotin/lipoyl-binding protein [Propionibacteriaceae bacterium]